MNVRLGLIGLGAWGRRYVETIQRRSDCAIVAFARGSSAGGAIDGAVRCDNWQELLALAKAGQVDGVIVASTPEHQAEVALSAALQAVPVLVEKPLGLSVAAAARVRTAQASLELPSPVLVNAVHLFAPAYRELKARVEARGGRALVTEIVTRGSNRGPLRSWSSLYDFGSHDLSLCLDLLGPDARFVLRHASRSPSNELPGGVLYAAEFDLNATRVRISVGNGASNKNRYFAVTLADGDALVYDDIEGLDRKLLDRGCGVPIAPTLPLDAALAEFIDQIGLWRERRLGARRARSSVELAVRVLEVLEAVDLASRP